MLGSRFAFGASAMAFLAACGGSSDSEPTSGAGGAGSVASSSHAGTGSGTTTTTTTSSTSATGSGGAGAATSTSSTSASAGSAGGGTSSSSGGTGGAAPFSIAVPQVASLGGKVLTAPKVQLIAYASDSFGPEVDAFITEFGTTSDWSVQTSEYGVGAFTKLPLITIAGTPPTSLDDETDGSPFEKTLAANITGASPAWGAADPETIYMFLLPQGTNILSAGSCCTDFLGYHYEATAGSVKVPYAVACHCKAEQGDPLTPIEYVTSTVSHELVESATDPFSNADPAFAQADDADAIWTIATGGEAADMCEYNADSVYTPAGSTYAIQRSWSNAAAKAGKDPCVPVPPGDSYFNAYASYDDSITLKYYGQSMPTKGVSIASGATKTISVTLRSEDPSAPEWQVQAWDLNEYLGGSKNTTVSLDKTTGKNGDVLQLTIKVNGYNNSWGGAGVVLESTSADGQQDNLTIFAVGK